MKLSLTLNGSAKELDIAPGSRLLDVLRDEECVSVKRGCETGDCGACCVLLDDEPVNSCVVPAAFARDSSVLTLEGLNDDPLMRRLQDCFLEAGAVQCGYCTPGLLIVAWKRIKEGGQLTELDVRHAMSGNLCRCTGNAMPVRAVLKAWESLT